MAIHSVTVPKFSMQDVPGPTIGPEDESPKHKRLADYCRRLIQMSEQFVANRWPQWQEADKILRCYVDVTETDDFTGRLKRPHDVKLVLPTSYTIHESILAYLYSVFTTKDTLFQIGSPPGRDPRASYLMEEILDRDCENIWHNARAKLYILLSDTLKYGTGIVQDEWQETWRKMTIRERIPMDLFGVPIGSQQRETRDWRCIHRGNVTHNVDPYSYLPDPRVPVSHVQDGDFVGYCWWKSWLSLKQGEREGRYYNIDHVEKFNRERHGAAFGVTQRYEVLGLPSIYDNTMSPEDRGFIIGHTLWLKIVPSDFDLGGGDDPEIWLITIANYDTIIRLERWDYDHAEYPVSVCEANYDGYSPMNPGTTELLLPLQDLGDWIIGSHMDNVKKMLNDMLVIDPSRINMDDLRHPGPAKWVRLRENAWGTDPREAVSQLAVQDVTGQFLTDYQLMAQMMNQAAGAVEPQVSSMVRGRKQQATVMQGMVQLASARHKVTAQVLSSMGIRRWARRLVCNIQQEMTEPELVRITGAKAKAMGLDPTQSHIIEADPDLIAGEYDYPVHTGDVPPDPARMMDVWYRVMMGVAGNQLLAQKFDVVAIFRQLAQSAGVKNIDDFQIKTQTMPDQQVMDGVQRGNLIPAGVGGGPGGAIAPGGTPNGRPSPTFGGPGGSVPGPRQSIGDMLLGASGLNQ